MSVHESERLVPARSSSGRPTLRLLPAPPSEPPYDDELPERPALHVVNGQLALPLPTMPGAAARLRLLPHGPARDDRSAVPAARPFALALVQRLLEVLAGLRPVTQLQGATTFELYSELESAIAALPRPSGRRPTPRDVRSLHVQEQDGGVAEVCATVRRGERAAALAFRLETVRGTWRCTALVGL